MPRNNGMADREPCPWRIVDDVGGAFCMGAIGGGVWHTVKGARLAPVGSRLQGSLSAVQARAPVLGGQFAVWGGLFACCDCTLTAIRQKVCGMVHLWTLAISSPQFEFFSGGSMELDYQRGCHWRNSSSSCRTSRYGWFCCGRRNSSCTY